MADRPSAVPFPSRKAKHLEMNLGEQAVTVPDRGVCVTQLLSSCSLDRPAPCIARVIQHARCSLGTTSRCRARSWLQLGAVQGVAGWNCDLLVVRAQLWDTTRPPSSRRRCQTLALQPELLAAPSPPRRWLTHGVAASPPASHPGWSRLAALQGELLPCRQPCLPASRSAGSVDAP